MGVLYKHSILLSMNTQFNKLIDKYGEVYLLSKRTYNKLIISLKMPYSKCGFGVRQDGSVILLLRNSNKIAIPLVTLNELCKNTNMELPDLLKLTGAILYTKQQNDLRISRKMEIRQKKSDTKSYRKERIAVHKDKLSKGEKSFIPLKIWVEYNKDELLKKSTKEEHRVLKTLRKKDKRSAILQKHFRINGRSYFADIYLPNRKLIIEIDGGYHTTRIDKDEQRDKDFLSIGIKTIRIPNEATNSNEYHKYMKLIRECK